MQPRILRVVIAFAFALASSAVTNALAVDRAQPNIVWIIGEDMGPDLGCWGTNVRTPNIDRLATEGVRYTRMFGTASVCMPNRTAMITGVTQTTLGAVTMRPPKQYMRPLPGDVKPLPAVLRELGYVSGNIRDKKFGSTAKDDWNFQFDGKGWDTKRLDKLPADRPFYAQFNFQMAHRPFHRDKKHPVDPQTVDLPPYYPDHPVSRQSWADYLESIQHLDRNVGRVLAWLDEKGLAERTIVCFLSDHGEAFLRGKYFLYDCSLNQPLIVRWPKACHPPEGFEPGTADDRMLAAIDLTAQTVAWAGGDVPSWMHGRAFLADNAPPRSRIFSAADWYGGGKLKSRSVRTDRYKYIRNFNTELSVTSASTEYRKITHPLFHLVPALAKRGLLSPLHQQLLLDPLPEEELYDLEADPHELNNLAGDASHAAVQSELRGELESWIRDSGDLGFEEKDPGHVKFFEDYRAKNHKANTKKRNALRKRVLDAVAAAS